MLNERLQVIVNILKDKDEYTTSLQLAQQMKISVRTIKSTLQKLKSEIEPHGAFLEMKRGVGYRLQIIDEKTFSSFLNRKEDNFLQQFLNTHKKRSVYIVCKLLSIDAPIPLDDLANELYICKNALSLVIKEVKKLLKDYHLVVKILNNDIVIEGSEIQKRNCINDFFFQASMTHASIQNNIILLSHYSQDEIRYIKEALLYVLNENHIHFSDISIQNMVIHILIQLYRCQLGQYVTLDQSLIPHIRRYQRAYKAANELKERLEERMNVVFPEYELIYLTMHILSKTVLESKDIQKLNLSYIDDLLDKIFTQIKERFSIDLHDDQEVYYFLKLHIPLMIERIKMQITMRNPFVLENNRHYQLAVEITLEAVYIIENIFNIQIDRNEFAYLVLYFHLALNKYFHQTKKRLILVCGYGRVEAVTILNVLNQNFKGLFEDIKICDIGELDHFVFNNHDVIITTIPLIISQHIPIVHIQGKIEDYYQEILSLFKSEHDIQYSIGDYLKPSLYKYGALCKNQAAVFKELFCLLKNVFGEEETIKLTRDIYSLAQEVGNETVCLHSRYDCQQPFIALICLKNQILWEKQQVKYIFFLNMNGETHKEIMHHMYQHISNWIETKSKIKNDQKYEKLIESLDHSY